MTNADLLTKIDDAIATCVDKARKMAEGEQAMGAKTLAEAAQTLAVVHNHVAYRIYSKEQKAETP